MTKTKPKTDGEYAGQYGVSRKTITRWKQRGYNLDDRNELFEAMENQRSQAAWFQRERARRDSIEEDRQFTIQRWGIHDFGRCLLTGRRPVYNLQGDLSKDFPFPFGCGANWTPEEYAVVTDESERTFKRSAGAFEDYWLGLIDSGWESQDFKDEHPPLSAADEEAE